MIFFGSKEKPEDLIYQAMSRMKKNQPKAAIPLLNQALKQEPTKIDNEDLEKLAKEAMKKFKSLS